MSKPRNIVVMLSDDHAQWAARCYGNTEISTPTLDHLARTGTLFENAFCPTPVCSPARASFWTGLMPSQHGVHDYLAESPDCAIQGETNLAELLSEAGYLTGLSGKWHLGGEGAPARGFDFWAMNDLTKAMVAAFTEFNGGHEIDLSVSKAFRSPWETPARLRANDGAHRIIDDAVDFISGAGDRPFFLYVGFHATHSPWAGHPERLVEQYRDCTFRDIPMDTVTRFGSMADESLLRSRRNPRETLAQYYAAVTQIDEQAGRLLDELADRDILDDTLVIYTSDHGLNLGHHGFWGKGNGTRPLNMYEESIRIPLILSHAGNDLFRGVRRSEYVTHCDTFRTVLDWAGTETPSPTRSHRALPGRSYRPLLEGRHVPDWPDAVFCEYGDVRMVRTLRHKLIHRYRVDRSELFDLQEDPREVRDLSGDPGSAARLSELRAMLDGHFARIEDPAVSGLGVSTRPSPNRWPAWVDTAPFV